MPNRVAQKRAKRRERRKKIIAGRKAQRVRFMRIRDEVADLGPEVAAAVEFFRKYDFAPDGVREKLEGPPPWAFAATNSGGVHEALLLTQEARDMVLDLMRTA